MSKELTIRRYAREDIPRISELIIKSVPQMPNYAMITPDADRINYVLTGGVDNAEAFAGWVLCDTHNTIQAIGAAYCVRSIISMDFVADDLFMWVEPEYRNYANVAKFLHAYTNWARAHGAKLIRASHTGGSFPKGSREAELYHALLRRFKFEEVGSVYHLSLYGDK